MRKRILDERIGMKVPSKFKEKIDRAAKELGISSSLYLEDVDIIRKGEKV